MARQSRLYNIEGTILARRDHGEADRVLVVLTDQGRMDLLAKGIRKPASRKAGHLELFTRARMTVARVKDSWDIVSQADAVAVRSRLQEDFQRGTYGRYVAELAIRFFEADSDPAVSALVDMTLGQLESDADPELLIRWYEQQVLVLAGFRPEWRYCVGPGVEGACQTPLRPRPTDKISYGLDLENGGALCPDCAQQRQGGRLLHSISPSALSWLQAVQDRERDELSRFLLLPQTRAELARIMEHYIAYHLERKPASLRLIQPEP